MICTPLLRHTLRFAIFLNSHKITGDSNCYKQARSDSTGRPIHMKKFLEKFFEATGNYARYLGKTYLYASAFLGLLILPILVLPGNNLDIAGWWLVVLVPLIVYGVSVAQHVSEDDRDMPRKTKIRQALLPGLNKMLFAILVLSIVFITLDTFDIGWD